MFYSKHLKIPLVFLRSEFLIGFLSRKWSLCWLWNRTLGEPFDLPLSNLTNFWTFKIKVSICNKIIFNRHTSCHHALWNFCPYVYVSQVSQFSQWNTCLSCYLGSWTKMAYWRWNSFLWVQWRHNMRSFQYLENNFTTL